MSTATKTSTAADRPLESLLREKREAILAIAAKHGATNVRLFGSVAQGAEHEGEEAPR